jgi:glutamyl-tRNA reductase
MPGPLLDRAFRQALHAGKRVRHETGIGESPSSVASAAAALAQQVFGELRGRRVLLIGAGKAGEQAADNLRSRGAEVAFVANRTPATAQAVAERLGGSAISLEQIGERVASVDVVVASTSAPGFVLGRSDVVPRRRPLLVLDIAVPRDVEPAVDELDACYLYDIDDLRAVVEETLAGRRSEASRAESIVAAEAERFREWRASLEVVPAIASLRARVEEIRERELERVRGRLSDAERSAVESVTARIVDKLLHVPTVRLKEAAAGAEGPHYADTVRHLFGLGEEERR